MVATSSGVKDSGSSRELTKKREWTFLTNYGRVLAYLAKKPRVTTREIAQEVGVTERAIQKVIHELEKDGYIVRHRVGRSNRYVVHPELPMRHALEREYAVGNLLSALGCDLRKSNSNPTRR